MKLLKRPERTVNVIETVQFAGSPHRVHGRMTISDAEISCPDFEDPKSVVWNRLKYGATPDLGDAWLRHTKIDMLEFPEVGLVLYGVMPFEQTRTAMWEGVIYKCKIDHYEVM